MRALIRFKKIGKLRYISHLDMVRTIERALHRADIPVAYSQGFNPHMLITFSPPTPLGMASSGEYADLQLVSDIAGLYLKWRINSVLPNDLRIMETLVLPDSAPHILNKAVIGRYVVLLEPMSYNVPLKQKLSVLESMDAIVVARQTKSGIKEMDIKPFVKNIYALDDESCLKMDLRLPSAGGIKPDAIIEALNRYTDAGIDLNGVTVCKEDILLEHDCRAIPIMEAAKIL